MRCLALGHQPIALLFQVGLHAFRSSSERRPQPSANLARCPVLHHVRWWQLHVSVDAAADLVRIHHLNAVGGVRTLDGRHEMPVEYLLQMQVSAER